MTNEEILENYIKERYPGVYKNPYINETYRKKVVKYVSKTRGFTFYRLKFRIAEVQKFIKNSFCTN